MDQSIFYIFSIWLFCRQSRRSETCKKSSNL